MATHYVSAPTMLRLSEGEKQLQAGDKVKLLEQQGESANVQLLPLLPGAPQTQDVTGSVPTSALTPVPTNVNWLPLESNPDVFNGFLKRVGGLKDGWQFADVLGLDDELLAFVPSPCRALILLHPSGTRAAAFKQRRRDLVAAAEGAAPISNGPPLYLTQHDESGNACGTIAVLHAIANARVPLEPVSVLSKFLAVAETMGPARAGWALLETDGMYEASDASAERDGDTATPDRDADTDFHFIAFVHANGRLWDMDGRKPHPVDCGATTEETFLSDAARVVREQYLALAPDDPSFSVLALCKQ